MKRAVLVLGLAVALLVWVISSTRLRADEPTYDLRSGRKAGQIDQVVSLMEVAGDRLERGDGKDAAAENRVPTTGVASLDYDERTLEIPSEGHGLLRTIRHYDKASVLLKVGEESLKHELRGERSLIGVEVEGPHVTMFAPGGPLNYEELDLIDIAANGLVLDQLLPEQPVAVGQTWKQPDQAICALLRVREVRKNEVTSVLKTVTPELARIELSGHVEGKINGINAGIDLQAKCRFDRKRKRIDWFAIRVQDKREISPVESGLDVTVRVQVKINAKDDCPALADAALKDLPLQATPKLRQLTYLAPDGAWQVTHDRAWFVVDSHRDEASLRLMGDDGPLAHCRILPGRGGTADKPITLPQFQEEVRTALGKAFSEFVEAEQYSVGDNRQIYRVIVRGQDADAPMIWQYFRVADGRRQAVLAFTLEEQTLKEFGKSGERLAQAIEFLQPKTAARKK